MTTIRMINAGFVRQDRNDLITDAINDSRAQRLLRLKGENRYRQMAVWAVECGSAETFETEFDKLAEEVNQRVLDTVFDGAKRKDLTADQKKEFNEHTNWFRSNRSVCKRAIELGVDLLDQYNMPKGKSAVQAENTAAANGDEPESKDPLVQFTKRLDAAMTSFDKIEDDDDVHAAIKLADKFLASLKDKVG